VKQIERLEVECYERTADLQQVWNGMTSLCETKRLEVRFDGNAELPVLVTQGEAAETQRDSVKVEYEGGGDNYRRVYEFFQGLGGRLQAGSGALGFTAIFSANLAQPLAPDAGEIEDLRRRLVENQVQQITLRARAAKPGA
jgi:hypothetical protein